MIASDLELFDAVIAALTDEGLLVGYAQAPDYPKDAQGRPTKPYVIVYPMPSGGTSGPMDAVNDDEDFVAQVTSVGGDPRQALVAATRAKRRLLSGGLTIPGRALMRSVSLDVGAGVSRDDDTAGPPLFYAVHRYRFATTPS